MNTRLAIIIDEVDQDGRAPEMGVRIRKSVLHKDLRSMPIDHGDMFLMSQAEDLIDASEVAEIMPWEAEETQRRLTALVKLGLLEWVTEQGQPLVMDGRSSPDFFVAVTLRPKAPQPVADLFKQTESSVVALRAMDGLVLLDQAVIHEDRSVFSRATLVKEDPERVGRPRAAGLRAPQAAPAEEFALPPLSGMLAGPAASPRVNTAPAPVQTAAEPAFTLPPLGGKPGGSLVREREIAAVHPSEDQSTFSLPPFPEDDDGDLVLPPVSHATQRRAPTLQMQGLPNRRGLGLDTSFVPSPAESPQAARGQRAQPASIGSEPAPGKMARATRAYEGEQATAFVRATKASVRPPPRGTAENARVAASVHNRRTVVDEDAEERSTQFEGSSARRR